MRPIAYCEGRSRAPSALYRFLEDNLFQIIDPQAIQEIYADSEYTVERQLVYLLVRSDMDVTMCLKQNRKIQRWKEETLAQAHWRPYDKRYRIASRDFRYPSGVQRIDGGAELKITLDTLKRQAAFQYP